MAIVKNNFRVSKLDGEFSPASRDSMSTDEDELHKRSSTSESDKDDDEDDDGVDSGAGSDDFDISELGEVGAESCQLGSSNCSIPFELYDLPDLGEVLTLDTWNNCLTEEERFALAEHLPDMDQETFMRTLRELFSGSNFHFGSPVAMLFDMLKEGLCEPRVTLYRQGLNFFQRREHYHLLRKYQNLMVGNLIQIRDAWENCEGYSIEERLRVLNIMRSQRSLMYEKMEDMGMETDTSDRDDSGEGFWAKRLKDIKLRPKIDHRDIYSVSPTLNNSSRGRPMPLESMKYGKSNPKGILKFAGSKALSVKRFVGCLPSSTQPGLESKSRAYIPTLALPPKDQFSGYDSESAPRLRGLKRGEEDAEGPPYEMDFRRDRTHANAMSKIGLFKPGKKTKLFKTEDEYAAESLMGLPLAVQNDFQSHGRSRNVNQMAELEPLKAKPSGEKSSYNCYSRVAGKKAKNSQKLQESSAKDQMKARKDQRQHLLLRGKRADWSVGREPIQNKKVQEEDFDVDHPVKHDEWSVKGKRWKMGKEFQTGKKSVGLDLKVNSHSTFPTQMNDMLLHSDYRTKASLDKVKKKSSLNGGFNMEEFRGTNMFARSEETYLDSSEQDSEEEAANPLRNKLGHPKGVEGHRSTSVKAIAKKGIRLGRKDREYAEALEQLRMADVDVYSSKGKQKGKIRDPSYKHTNASGISEESGYAGIAKTDDGRKKTYKLGKNGLKGEPGVKLHLPSIKAYPPERKHRGKVDHDYSVPRSNFMHDYINEEENDLHRKHRLVDDHGLITRLGKKGQNSEAHLSDRHERSNIPLLGCNSKKRKGKADVKHMDGPDESHQMQASPEQQVEDPTSLKKRGKRKVDAETDSLAIEISEPLVSERGTTNVEAESKPPKKPFTLITPTVHTGFSFSIIHLLSAVRMAMITPNAEDSSELGNHHSRSDGRHKSNNEEQSIMHERTNVDMNNSELEGQKTLPSLTVQDIVNRVRSNPGDPCILETQEPLQDLVRGVLKVFSSKTAPLGAKGWKPLVCYEKCTKSWSWIGPFTDSSSDLEAAEEETSSEAWGLPHKMLVKLVDSFANWLKSGQETLQQIGSLPAPPVTLMQPNLDEKERFRDLRAQKSLTTISPSSEEVRAYFRKEELLRYSVPDRAFSYTAADGRKSIVAPLRRCGGKPTSKARDHFMLKPDRPPHVTILCLVRDAAARLPGSIGTRADVCTLIRDSQYIVENVSDAQINQVVSGALDRLHYERDPCVQFDGDRKLWVYLHREREEEDFEDDGTSSTKKWKRQRKDATEQSDPGTLNISYHGSGEPIAGGSVYDLGSDLNVEPSPIHEGRKTELGYNDSKRNVEDDVESHVGSGQGGVHLGHPVVWEARENKMLCQENSTNEDFDDETFNRERPVGLLSAGL